MTIKPVYFYSLALVGFFGLFALMMLWPTVLAHPAHFPVALVLILTVGPLLLPMRGLLDQRLNSCSWAAYISLFYFIHGSVEAYSNSAERIYAGTEVLFSLALFFGATFYVRARKHAG